METRPHEYSSGPMLQLSYNNNLKKKKKKKK